MYTVDCTKWKKFVVCVCIWILNVYTNINNTFKYYQIFVIVNKFFFNLLLLCTNPGNEGIKPLYNNYLNMCNYIQRLTEFYKSMWFPLAADAPIISATPPCLPRERWWWNPATCSSSLLLLLLLPPSFGTKNNHFSTAASSNSSWSSTCDVQ